MYTHFADHVGHNYTNGADVRQAILKIETPTFPTPTLPTEGADSGQMHKWEKSIDGIIKREDILYATMKMLFSLIWEQYTEVFCIKIVAVSGFVNVSNRFSPSTVKNETYNFQSQKSTS